MGWLEDQVKLRNAVFKGKLARVRQMIKRGVSADATSFATRETTLHIASQYGHLPIVKYLVEEEGANIEAKTSGGDTPLDFALKNGHTDVVQYLEANLAQLQHERQQQQSERAATVFISHTGADEKAADWAGFLETSLRLKYQIDCFLDSSSIKTGDTWRKKIEGNAKGCDVFVVVMSEHYFRRFWCLHELDLALQNGRIIVPVFFGDGVEIPKARDADFANQLYRMLSEKDLDEDLYSVLNRWLGNMATLDNIQGHRNESTNKHWMSHFCDEVSDHVSELLGKHS